MNSINALIKKADQHCQSNGARLTDKRKQILSSLIQFGKAISAYDLIDLCEQASGEKIPAMSVYRILEFLESVNLVHKLNLANKYVACSSIGCKHEHAVSLFLICNVCNQVEEVDVSQPITDQLKGSVSHAGFTLVKPHLEMKCICNGCLNSDEANNQRCDE